MDPHSNAIEENFGLAENPQQFIVTTEASLSGELFTPGNRATNFSCSPLSNRCYVMTASQRVRRFTEASVPCRSSWFPHYYSSRFQLTPVIVAGTDGEETQNAHDVTMNGEIGPLREQDR